MDLHWYDASLEGLFGLLDEALSAGKPPERVLRKIPGRNADAGPLQADLFGEDDGGRGPIRPAAKVGTAGAGTVPQSGILLNELSVNAFDAFIHAWMSELPIDTEIVRFGFKVISPAGTEGRAASPEARRRAERAAFDRGDPDVRAVLNGAYKTKREIDRLMGFLRFSPGAQGWIARCAPDHFVLPGLAEHFTLRFGGESWLIIDEKRKLVLAGQGGAGARIMPFEPAGDRPPVPEPDPYETLWRRYHRIINNESRNNPGLQLRFMPLRYRKYLPEELFPKN
jgi:hypothetical protein